MSDFVMRLIGEDKTKEATDSAKSNIESLGGVADKVKDALVGMAAGLSVHAFSEMIKGTIDANVRLTELGDRLHMGVDTLSQYKYIAEANSIELETLTGSFQKMEIAVTNAAGGSGEAAAALKKLHLSAADLHDLSPEDQFEKIADRLSELGNQGDKAQIAMSLFGKQGVQLLPIMEDGAKGLQEMRAQADKLGLTISKETGQQLKEFDDIMDGSAGKTQGLKNIMMAELLPSLLDVGHAFEGTSGNADILKDVMDVVGAGIKGTALIAVAGAELFTSFGNAIGALAAEAVAVANGDFKKAAEIWNENAADEDRAGNRLIEMYHKLFDAKVEAASAEKPEKKKTGYDSGVEAAVAAHQKEIDSKLAIDQSYSDQISEMWDKQIEDEQAAQNDRIAKHQEAAQKVYEATRTPLEQFTADYEELTALYQQGYFDALGGAETYYREIEKLNEKRTQSEMKNATMVARWEQMTMMQRASTAVGVYAEMFQAFSGHSKKMFEISKALSIVKTIINTREAAVGAYKAMVEIPIVGPALAAAAAAAAIGFGMAQVAEIAGAQFGGSSGISAIQVPATVGSSGASYSGSDITAGTSQPSAQPAKNIYINIEGGDSAQLSGSQVRKLIDLLNEEIKTGNIRIQA